MSGESEDESKGRLTVCYILVDVIILGLFGWSKIVAQVSWWWVLGKKLFIKNINLYTGREKE